MLGSQTGIVKRRVYFISSLSQLVHQIQRIHNTNTNIQYKK